MRAGVAVIVALAVVVGAGLVLSADRGRPATAPVDGREGQFVGKAVLVEYPGHCTVLKDAQVKRLGDRLFLSGQSSPRQWIPFGITPARCCGYR
jgi:hypothetical protein